MNPRSPPETVDLQIATGMKGRGGQRRSCSLPSTPTSQHLMFPPCILAAGHMSDHRACPLTEAACFLWEKTGLIKKQRETIKNKRTTCMY